MCETRYKQLYAALIGVCVWLIILVTGIFVGKQNVDGWTGGRADGWTNGNTKPKDRPQLIFTDANTKALCDIVLRADVTNDDAATPIYDFRDITPTIKYRDLRGEIKRGAHMGQRKLLLTEIQFYMCYVRGEALVIYVGSASGEHTPTILKLFPRLKLLLIDPNYHNIDPAVELKYVYANKSVICKQNTKLFRQFAAGNSSGRAKHLQPGAKRLHVQPFVTGEQYDMLGTADDAAIEAQRLRVLGGSTLIDSVMADNCRVFVIQDYLTPALSKFLGAALAAASTKPPVYFVSDIRSVMYDVPSDVDYVWNYALQAIAMFELRPKFSMLKFHPPYFVGVAKFNSDANKPHIKADLDLIRDEYKLDMAQHYRSGYFKYFAADQIFIQAWANRGSSETRLIVAETALDSPMVTYDHARYDDTMFTYRYHRAYKYHAAYDLVKSHPDCTYDACADCTLEMFILGQYLEWAENPSSEPMKMDWARARRIMVEQPDRLFELRKHVDEVVYYGVGFCPRNPLHGELKRRPKKSVYLYELLPGRRAIRHVVGCTEPSRSEMFGILKPDAQAHFALSAENMPSTIRVQDQLKAVVFNKHK